MRVAVRYPIGQKNRILGTGGMDFGATRGRAAGDCSRARMQLHGPNHACVVLVRGGAGQQRAHIGQRRSECSRCGAVLAICTVAPLVTSREHSAFGTHGSRWLPGPVQCSDRRCSAVLRRPSSSAQCLRACRPRAALHVSAGEFT